METRTCIHPAPSFILRRPQADVGLVRFLGHRPDDLFPSSLATVIATRVFRSPRLRCLVLAGALAGWSVPAAFAQSYTLNDLAGRAASAATVPTGAGTSSARANDLGLRLNANTAYYPNFATAGDGAARGGLRASADVVWELFESGLGEARYEAARANARATALSGASSTTPAMTAAQAQFRARGLALTLLQAEARAFSATEAARLADSAAARYRRLYATRDVLRSTAMRADVEARRMQSDAERFSTAARLLRGELSRQLQLPATFVITPPDGLPAPDEAALERGVRVNVTRAFTVSPDAFPDRYPWEDFRFALYAGYAYRELYGFDGTNGGGAGSGPRVGMRLSVPLRFGPAVSTASVVPSNPIEREARVDASTQQAMTRLADLLDEFYRAASRYAERQAQAEIERVRLEESQLLASGGLRGERITPNEVMLAEAHAREALGEAEAARLEAWRVYYELLALSGN